MGTLSRLLADPVASPWVVLVGLCIAFGLGALHALEPGHGKTLVAAYLVGSRGTLRHALLLGAVVTFTHTVSVFALGFGVLLFQNAVQPEKIIPILGFVSGLAIVVTGLVLLVSRWRALRHQHDHEHAHDHHHHHEHGHDHHHPHLPEGGITAAGLIALGVSGGLAPCPSALVLLLSAIALGRTALGMVLLTFFSLGLGLALIALGAVVLYSKNLLPERTRTSARVMRYLPVASAAVVTVLGLVMTVASLRAHTSMLR